MACRRGGLRGDKDSLEFDSIFKITQWYFLETGALQSLATGNNNSDNSVVSPDTVSTSVQNNNQEVIELRGLVKQEEEKLEEQAAILDDQKSASGVGQQRRSEGPCVWCRKDRTRIQVLLKALEGQVLEESRSLPGRQ